MGLGICIKDVTYNKPQIIADWLLFLPNDYESITAIYRRPSSETVMFIGDKMYMTEYPGLRLLSGYPKSISTLEITSNAKLHAVASIYSGQTFIF